MKNSRIAIFIFTLLSFFIISCNDFVLGVDELTNDVTDGQLDSEEQIQLLVVGLQGTVGVTGDDSEGLARLIWRVGGYSDEMVHGTVDQGAPDHVSFVQDFIPDLRFYERDYANVNRFHFLADDLVRRVNRVESESGFSNTALKNQAIWWGNVIGGISRMYLADHWGARPLQGDTPGAPMTSVEQLSNGEFGSFFSSLDLHAMAREKFNAALGTDPGDVENSDKFIWSLMARTYLFDGMDAEAKSAAEKGLQQGDESFEILHTQRFPNQMWAQSGRAPGGEVLFSPHPRFIQYVLDDRKEGEIISALTQDDIDEGIVSRSLRGIESGDGEPGNAATENPRSDLDNQNERLPLWEKIIQTGTSGIGDDTQWAEFKDGATATQDFYSGRSDGFVLIDWREMELILAEVAINGGDNGTGLDHINNVRIFHGLDAYTMDDMMNYDNPKGGASQSGIAIKDALSTNKKFTGPLGLLIEERDKTLWMKGTRLADQKRFELWHLEGDRFFRHYLPIPRSETDVNPNIPQ